MTSRKSLSDLIRVLENSGADVNPYVCRKGRILMSTKYDLFISHASEDKEMFVRPLANYLTGTGLNLWYDELSLRLGDSLRANIDLGLRDSRFGLVVLSHAFFAKKWPQEELNGLFAKEIIGDKTILPIWHGVSHRDVANYSPILADRVAVQSSQGLDKVVEAILKAIHPEVQYKALKGRAMAIAPTFVHLWSKGWAMKTQVTVFNDCDRPLHAVSVMFYIKGAAAESLEVEVAPTQAPFEDRIGDIVVSAVNLMVTGNNETGEVLLLVLHTVPANGSVVFTVKGTAQTESTAELSIASFEQSPPNLAVTAGKISFPFAPPESFKLKSIRILMRRDK
jgi:hypothetical protein